MITLGNFWVWLPGALVPVLACGLAGAHAVLARIGGPSWLASYLDDLFCLPLILGLIVAVQRQFRRDPRWVLPFGHGLAALALFSIYFEVILPQLRFDAVADPLDVVMYGLGLFVFQLLMNRPGRPAVVPSG